MAMIDAKTLSECQHDAVVLAELLNADLDRLDGPERKVQPAAA